MRDAETPMPPGIALIGWLWIITGGLMILSGAAGVFGYAMMRSMGGAPETTGDALPQMQLMTWMYDYFWIALAGQLVVAAVSIGGGIGLLQLRPWARTTIEILCWLSLVYVFGFAGYWWMAWNELTMLMYENPGAMVPESARIFGLDAGVIDPEGLRVVGWIINAVLTVIFVIPLALMIRKLRGSVVRSAFARAATARSHAL